MSNETKEKPLIYWRDQIDQKIINAVYLGMKTGLRGHVDFDPMIMERLYEVLEVSQGLSPDDETKKRIEKKG